MEWDVSLTKRGDSMVVAIPSAVGRVLIARGQFRAKVSVTEAGILVVPYKHEGGARRQTRSVEVPEWGT